MPCVLLSYFVPEVCFVFCCPTLFLKFDLCRMVLLYSIWRDLVIRMKYIPDKVITGYGKPITARLCLVTLLNH